MPVADGAIAAGLTPTPQAGPAEAPPWSPNRRPESSAIRQVVRDVTGDVPLASGSVRNPGQPWAERWRSLHRNMYLMGSGLAVAAVIVALVRAPTWG